MEERGTALTEKSAVEERVLEVVRSLASETGGERAARAVTPGASLERDVGLGSLERVELMLRLETAFGRSLDDRLLQAETPSDIARLLAAAGPAAESSARAPEARPLSEATAPEHAATIHESLWRRGQSQAARPHVYLREDDGSDHVITYGDLLAQALSVAGALRERGIRRGDTVALMLPTSRDFLFAFQGILMAGAIPVPIYPPVRLDRIEEYARRQSAILADAGARLLITIPRGRVVAAILRPGVPSLEHVVTVADLTAAGTPLAGPEGACSDPAFVQYTSGSTGAPKGVLLTHDNLLANISAIAAGLEAKPTDVGASWLPLYHDMGLIGSWLFCMHLGIPLALMSPLAFLSRPERWLWAIHQRRATLSPAPNFAYELCVRRVPERALEGLDLSSWRVALNGAEPVPPETLERFAQRFAPCGFRRQALLPVYGLAESSVALCFPPVGRGPRVESVAREPFEREGRAPPAAASDPNALRFVSVGRALPEHEVRLVDHEGRDVGERKVGRLVFRGPSVTAGYFNKPEATAAVTLPGGWLDSGDLGFMADGEVFITGRRKDLIIKGGRNLVPQEIEEVAASVEGIRRGCVVAFGVTRAEMGTEGLVVVAETRRREAAARDRLAAAVTERVAEAVGVPPDTVALVAPGAVPKTSSGKVRRAETRDLYLRGDLGRADGPSLATRARLLAALAGPALGRLSALPRTLYALWLALLVGVLVVVVWLPMALVPSRRLAAIVSRLGARALLGIGGCRTSVEGAEHVATGGPYLLASNHASYLDVLAVLALLPRAFAFVAKHEVLRMPIVSTIVRRAGHLTVERFDVSQSVADTGKVAHALEEGRSVLIFPEGTFTHAAGLRPFRLGTFKTAVETGTPIIPLALRGTRQVLRAGQWLPRPGPIHLWVGAPIAPQGDGWRAVVALRDRVAEAIAGHTGEPRLDLVAGGPERG